jgi:hypothetical protein
MTTALDLVAAIAWDTAVRRLFNEIFGEAGQAGRAVFYATLMTLMVIFANNSVSRVAERVPRRQRRSVKGGSAAAQGIAERLNAI